MHGLSQYQLPALEGTFVTTDESTLMSLSKSLVYIRAHSWTCTFYGFRWMHNDMYPSLEYHTDGISLLC
uniref:Uncharacterized protein n=1 Tax=Catagonus wagneri TaxID=51154 RepID=A0A8C3WIZ0_9CETA